MNTFFGPGTYTIKLNGLGKPSLYAADGTTPLDDPTFETIGNASLVFKIIYTRDLPVSFAFIEPPLTWRDLENKIIPEPFGNSHQLAGEAILTLNVSPPAMLPATQTYHFDLHLKVGDIPDEVLWSDDGSRRLDPTIIEKPPEP